MPKKIISIFLMLIPFLGESQGFEPNYGISFHLNYPTLGNNLTNYAGRGMYSFGMFYQKPISPYHSNRVFNRFDFMLEPAISYLSFRDVQSDKRYNSTFLDFTGYLNFVPDRMSEDLRLMFGARPSVLLFSNSQNLDYGTYRTINNDPNNLNVKGRIDFCGVVGISLSLGKVASVELKYIKSFTDQNTASIIKGRPSVFEFGLRLSAIKLRDKLVANEKTLSQELNKRSAGTLLIMLESPNRKFIQQLIQENKIEDADYVTGTQLQTNRFIISQFRKQFNFCRVLFFTDSNAHKVNQGLFNDLFVDENLKPIESVSFDTSNYFIGSFCEDVSDYSNKPAYGLYLYDRHFKQLGKPYNTGSNYMNIFVGGDPMNYFRRIKTSNYTPDDFGRIIKKFNDRLMNSRIQK